MEVGTRKNLFVIKLSWSKNCRIDCEIICCVMVCVYPCCLFLVGTQDAGLSMVTCTLFWGARIVAGEICVLNWLRDDTLCHVISTCLLSTFLGWEFLLFSFVPSQNPWRVNCKLEIGGTFVVLRNYGVQMALWWAYEQCQQLHPMCSIVVDRKMSEAKTQVFRR